MDENYIFNQLQLFFQIKSQNNIIYSKVLSLFDDSAILTNVQGTHSKVVKLQLR